jgi:hypothetical protein
MPGGPPKFGGIPANKHAIVHATCELAQLAQHQSMQIAHIMTW